MELYKTPTISHRYKGQDYTVTQNNLGDFDQGFLQSLSTRLSKQYPKPSKRKVPSFKKSGKGSGYDDTVVTKDNKATIIKRELIRLSMTEIPVEEKLHYPKVFQKLITEPHLALEQFRQTREYYQDLYLFVDEAVGYNQNDNGFHHSMIKEAKKIKGIKLYSDTMLRIKGDYYIQQLRRLVPTGKKIIVFSQGCGGSYGEIPKGYHVHFVTHFEQGCNCGCNTIARHEEMALKHKSVTMHYGVDTPEKLTKLLI